VKKNLFLSPHLQVRASDIEGRGVFCCSDVKKGCVLEEAHMILLENNKWEECDKELARYVLPWIELREDWKQFCDEHDGIASIHATRPVTVLGFGMIYNHADDNNVDYFVDKQQFICTFKANRDIEAGSELTINYGDEYFLSSKIKKR
jgi:hypothetical protein